MEGSTTEATEFIEEENRISSWIQAVSLGFTERLFLTPLAFPSNSMRLSQCRSTRALPSTATAPALSPDSPPASEDLPRDAAPPCEARASRSPPRRRRSLPARKLQSPFLH